MLRFVPKCRQCINEYKREKGKKRKREKEKKGKSIKGKKLFFYSSDLWINNFSVS